MTGSMDAQAEKEKLLAQVLGAVDPKHRDGMNMAVPTALKMYGVKIPTLREIAKEWYGEHKKLGHEEFMELFEALWEGESREELVLALELLQCYKKQIPLLTWAHFERWRHRLDNWEVTDILGVRILGPWVLFEPGARTGHLSDLIADEDRWSRRLALVSTVWLNRGRKGVSHPDLTFELVDRVKEERDPMITKAVSWALRELSKRHADALEAYVGENRGALAPHVVREVDNKLRTGLKSGRAGD